MSDFEWIVGGTFLTIETLLTVLALIWTILVILVPIYINSIRKTLISIDKKLNVVSQLAEAENRKEAMKAMLSQ